MVSATATPTPFAVPVIPGLPADLFAAKSGTATPIGVDAVRSALRTEVRTCLAAKARGDHDSWSFGRVSGLCSGLMLLGLMTADEVDAVLTAASPEMVPEPAAPTQAEGRDRQPAALPDDAKGGPFPDDFDDVALGADARPFTEGGASC